MFIVLQKNRTNLLRKLRVAANGQKPTRPIYKSIDKSIPLWYNKSMKIFETVLSVGKVGSYIFFVDQKAICVLPNAGKAFFHIYQTKEDINEAYPERRKCLQKRHSLPP